MIPKTTPRRFIYALAALATLGAAACEKEEDPVRVAREPKESTTPATEPAATAAPTLASADGEIQWDIPPGWERVDSAEAMRYATFQVSKDNPKVVLTVVALGEEPGSLAANVNRWEGQLGLPPTPADQLGKVAHEHKLAGGETAIVVDLAAPATAEHGPFRMLAGIIPHAGKTWFIKLAGEDAIVAAQHDNFESFINSIRFERKPADPAPPVAQAPSPAASAAGALTYSAPANWDKQPPKPMREVSFTAKTQSGDAEIIVTKLPPGAGSFEMNVNRWRSQVGLGPVDDVQQVTGRKVKVGSGEGTAYDFVGPAGSAADQKRQVVVMAERPGIVWFFKIIGPAPVVQHEMGAFESFLASVKLGEPGE